MGTHNVLSPRRRGYILLSVMLSTRYLRYASTTIGDPMELASNDAFAMIIHGDVDFDGSAFHPTLKALSDV